MELNVDINELTVSEIEEIEDLLEMSIDEAFGRGSPRGKAMRAIGFIAARRDNPEFTWADAGALVVRFAEPDPTDAGG